MPIDQFRVLDTLQRHAEGRATQQKRKRLPTERCVLGTAARAFSEPELVEIGLLRREKKGGGKKEEGRKGSSPAPMPRWLRLRELDALGIRAQIAYHSAEYH